MTASELSLVIPVYNEERAIQAVIDKWTDTLAALDIDFSMHLYNDGSIDATADVIKRACAENPRLVLHSHENMGHGPTILRGYRENCDSAWIFQVDSDDEMEPTSFADLWAARDRYDLLIARRVRHSQPPSRRLMSLVSRFVVHNLYGRLVYDVNAPYRLMRTASFKRVFLAIPERTFAPNLIVSGMASRLAMRVCQIDVDQHARTTGQVSIKKWKLVPVAARSLWQTLRFRYCA